MDTILQTSLLEYAKCTFLIELMETTGGKKYVRITQTIEQPNGRSEQQQIKVNPAVLADIIAELETCQSQLLHEMATSNRGLPESRKEELVSRYLKGVPLPELVIQFDKPIELLKQILRNKGVEVLEDYPPPKKAWRRWKKKRG